MPTEIDPYERSASAAPPRPKLTSFQNMDDPGRDARAAAAQVEIEADIKRKRLAFMFIATTFFLMGFYFFQQGMHPPPVSKQSMSQHGAQDNNNRAPAHPNLKKSKHKKPTKPFHYPAGYAEALRNVEMVMDTTVDPCDDFYAYACGGWLKQTKLKTTQTRVVRTFTSIFDRNEEVNKEVLMAPDAAASSPLLHTYWTSCMDVRELDQRGMKPV
jgi:hypothetical protein